MSEKMLVVKLDQLEIGNMLRKTPNPVKRALKILALQQGEDSMYRYVAEVLVQHLRSNGFDFMTLADPKDSQREEK